MLSGACFFELFLQLCTVVFPKRSPRVHRVLIQSRPSAVSGGHHLKAREAGLTRRILMALYECEASPSALGSTVKSAMALVLWSL